MERLPLFGEKVRPDLFTFNWPKTMGLLKGDLSKLRVAKILTIKSDYDPSDISDIQVELTDGRRSPIL